MAKANATSPAQHTPGPWTLQGIEADQSESLSAVYRVRGPSEFPDIAEVYFRDTDEETDANARLIAAAPELLDALSDLVGGCGKEGDLFCSVAMEKARAVIGKATGQAA